jgi:hypothetical protein
MISVARIRRPGSIAFERAVGMSCQCLTDRLSRLGPRRLCWFGRRATAGWLEMSAVVLPTVQTDPHSRALHHANMCPAADRTPITVNRVPRWRE